VARAFAQSRVFYVTAGQKGALAERALRVESVDVEGGWHQLYSEEPKLPEPAAKLLKAAQQVISFVAGPEDTWARNVKRFAPEAPLTTLRTIPADDFAGHVTDHMLAQLRSVPVIAAAMGQMLQSIASRGLGGVPPAVGPVVLHPGAGSGKKCWPAERFLELAGLLKGSGRNVQVILGDVEREGWPREQIEAFARNAEVREPQTLVELKDVLAGASAFVGNDSGPGHLAGIIGIPTFSIFGPKDPARWRPLGPRVATVTGEWEEITAQRVLTSLG
jgi:hypothetical protein